MNFERLPLTYRAPFDCINDNANCPACKRQPDNHGVCGSVAVFDVRTEHAGQRYAVVLRLLGGDYLPITHAWWRATDRDDAPQPHRAAEMSIHREHPEGDPCGHLGEGRLCETRVEFLKAQALFAEYGDSDSTRDLREQPEALWLALEQCLIEEIFGKSGGAA